MSSNGHPDRRALVLHAELWGVREAKYRMLAGNDVSTTEWSELSPEEPYYFFTPWEGPGEEYQSFTPVDRMFRVYSSGMTTERDRIAIHFDQNDLEETLRDFRNRDVEVLRTKYDLHKDSRDWTVRGAIEDTLANVNDNELVQEVLYRPFDYRKTWYSGRSRGFVGTPVPMTGRHMVAGPNRALLVPRQTKENVGAFVSRSLAGHKSFSAYDRTSIFPLYLYPSDQPTDLFDAAGEEETAGERRPNLSPEVIADFAERLGMEFLPEGTGDRVHTFGPEDVFHYMYAVFHSPAYRERYAEFLKIDFPRLPLTTDAELFRDLCALGEELTALHLMQRQIPLITRFPVPGDNTVDKVRYTAPGQGAEEGRVWINSEQYFDGVPPEIWQFYVGGYQVAEKWLKDRKGRQLTFDDLLHYQRTLAALSRTMKIMDKVDQAIDEHGGWPLPGSVTGRPNANT